MRTLARTESQELQATIIELCDALCREIPAKLICVAVGQWVAMMQNRDPAYVHASMSLLGGVFGSKNHRAGSLQSNAISALAVRSDIFATIGSHLQGPLHQKARDVMAYMVSCATRRSSEEDTSEWERGLETGMNLHKTFGINSDQVVAALTALLDSCPQHLRKSSRRVFMPFISDNSQTPPEPRTPGKMR